MVLSFSLFESVSICFIHLGAPILGAHMLTSVISFARIDAFINVLPYLYNLVLKSILYDMRIAIPVLSFLFGWSIFVHSLSFE